MKGKYFWGIILILVGAGFLLEQFEIITFGDILSIYWPSIIILFGVAGLFDRRSSKFGSLLLIIIGGLLQIDRLDLIEGSAFKLFWPVILILIGLKIIFGRGSIVIDTDNTVKNNTEKKTNFKGNITLEDSIDEFAMMSGIETNNQSQQFKGGRTTAIMGGIEIDLRGAKLHNNEAIIEATAIMGGIDIFVPDDWRVEVSGTPILGGWSNKTKYNTDLNSPVLKIKCFIMFGGIEVK